MRTQTKTKKPIERSRGDRSSPTGFCNWNSAVVRVLKSIKHSPKVRFGQCEKSTRHAGTRTPRTTTQPRQRVQTAKWREQQQVRRRQQRRSGGESRKQSSTTSNSNASVLPATSSLCVTVVTKRFWQKCPYDEHMRVHTSSARQERVVPLVNDVTL